MSSGLQDLRVQLRQVVISLWRRRWTGVAAAWVVALAAIPIILVIPNRYVASAQIYVDTQTVLKPLMQGLAYTPDVDQQVRMLARTLISRPNVERLVTSPEVGPGALAAPAQRERAIAELMQQIKVGAVAGAGNLYAISYLDADPERALRTVEATLALFVDAGADSKRRDSLEAGRFIDEQIKVYEAKLIEAENRLKEFKLRNFGVSGVSDQDYFVRMSTVSEEVSKLRIELSAAEQSRDAFKRELAGESPTLPPEASANGAAPVSETESRLEAQRKLLDELLRRYTDAHPDVTATRRVIEQLEARRRQEIEERARATDKSRAPAATSPVYQKIRVSLADAEAQVASLRSQLALKQARLDQLRSTAGRIPQIEAELAQLNRDYDILGKNYRDLVARRESASIGVRLDEQSKLADFRIVEPPRVSPTPAFPSRLHLAAIALLAAIVAGLAVPIGLDVIAPTYSDARKLRDATGREVLGVVSMAMTPAVAQRLRSQGMAVAAACGGLLVVQIVWLLFVSGRFPRF